MSWPALHDDNGRAGSAYSTSIIVGQWAKEIQRNPARDEEGVFENTGSPADLNGL